MVLGAHVSAAAGLRKAVDRALKLEVDAVQLCTRSATRWFTPPLEPDEVLGFRHKAARFSRSNLLALASPLINLAASDEAIHKRSLDALYDEIMRAEALGMAWVVVAAGNHGGQGEEWGVRRVIQSLNRVLDRTRNFRCGVLLEAGAGDENALGSDFDQLARIRRRIDDGRRVGVCLDTAKLFAAGYDFRDLPTYRQTTDELQRTIGLKHVHALHINDSLYPLGSHRAASTHIGEGEIGSDGFAFFINDERVARLPMIIETPHGPEGEEDVRNLNRLTALLGTVSVQAN